jgi:maltooligosyltrehalose trehalohydrolase
MELIPLDDLSVKTYNAEAEFGILLPQISAEEGYKVFVHVIHEHDQFLQNVPVVTFELEEKTHSQLNAYGSYWHIKFDITEPKAPNSVHWGIPGKYLYRYSIESRNGITVDWINDPFARELGMGRQSSFKIGGNGSFSWAQAPEEPGWKVPDLNDLIVYQAMIHEFVGDFSKAIRMLDYLADLGINALEIMPLSNLERTVDWGHEPLAYFGVDERFGDSSQLKLFVAEAHKRGIAIIADMACGHVSHLFPYVYIYDQLGFDENKHPFYGIYGDVDYNWGKKADYNKKFVRDFFFTVCHFWLEQFHIDGIHYESVPEFYEKHNVFNPGFSNLVYHVHQLVKSKKGDEGWGRFHSKVNEKVNLIQCAEYLEEPEEILFKTYSNCIWQNHTLNAAVGVAKQYPGALKRLGMHLGLSGFPSKAEFNNEVLEKTAFQYIENHNHPRFICNFSKITTFEHGAPRHEIQFEGNRLLWHKLRPYLIGLFTAKGIPLLWQGQEFLENHDLPESGPHTTRILRPLRWDYYYTDAGRAVLSLIRRLINIRKLNEQFRSGHYDFWNDHDAYLSKGVLVYTRSMDSKYSIVVLNFEDIHRSVPLSFKFAGTYRDELSGREEYFEADGSYELEVPPDHGIILNLKGSH